MKTKIVLLTILFLNLVSLSSSLAQADASLNISITTSLGAPHVTLENSVYKAILRYRDGSSDGIKHAIRDWQIKPSNNVNIVTVYIDGSSHRGPCTSATITNNGLDEKTVRLNYFESDPYNDYIGVIEYTIYANSPIIKVDYIQYDYSGSWANCVDWTNIDNGAHKVYGAENYGPYVFYPFRYWDASNEGTNPIDGGGLNFRDHMIMVYGQSGATGFGYGRIMPIRYYNFPEKTNQGGIRILNLLSSIRGYEVFPATANGYKVPFTGFLYVFSTGRDEAINFGLDIIDAHVDGTPLPLPVELISFNANIKNNLVELSWQTATEINNYGFEIERKLQNNVWENIGFVPGFGNSNSPKTYAFSDKRKTSGELSYRLKQIDNDGTYEYSKIIQVAISQPLEFSLAQNYPNPFNPSTKINYNLGADSQVNLTVFNSIGEKVAELVNKIEAAGNYSIEFNAADISSGVYLYVLSGNSIDNGESFRVVKKMSVLK